MPFARYPHRPAARAGFALLLAGFVGAALLAEWAARTARSGATSVNSWGFPLVTALGVTGLVGLLLFARALHEARDDGEIR